jgi:hypothetical protein
LGGTTSNCKRHHACAYYDGEQAGEHHEDRGTEPEIVGQLESIGAALSQGLLPDGLESEGFRAEERYGQPSSDRAEEKARVREVLVTGVMDDSVHAECQEDEREQAEDMSHNPCARREGFGDDLRIAGTIAEGPDHGEGNEKQSR